MPRLLEAKKDVVSCEKLRDLQTRFDPQISEWDNPAGREASHTVRWANPLN